MNYSPQTLILELDDRFYDRVTPAEFPAAIPRFLNTSWAHRVGLHLDENQWRKHFHRFEPLEGSLEAPLALRYHGHQFQTYNERLGDGRGFLFAQLKDNRDRVLDLGTKGSGQTPYSRAGDGKLTLKGAMREALATEMLESLGVNTSKTFCFFETGEDLVRGDEPSPTRSAVLTRLSHSHIRFGTFQRQAFLKDQDALRTLVSYCVRNFYPHLKTAAEIDWPHLLLVEVTRASAKLCASWMMSGFVHGVLNTDNMSITGESFDYGPYRFLPHYDPEFTAAYFDQSGLYAYGRQPDAVMWNLERLAECLLFLMGNDEESKQKLVFGLKEFSVTFNENAASIFRDRLGLKAASEDKEADLLHEGFNFLAQSQVPFEQFFFDWYGGALSRSRALSGPEKARYNGDSFEAFAKAIEGWEAHSDVEVRLKDSYFTRLRPSTLLIDEIEAIWKPISEKDDWSLFEAKIKEIREMGQLYGRRDNSI